MEFFSYFLSNVFDMDFFQFVFGVFELHLLRSAWKDKNQKNRPKNKKKKNEVVGCFLDGLFTWTWAFVFFGVHSAPPACYVLPVIHWVLYITHMLLSPCVLNAAGGASDTPVATPREPYRVIDIQNSRFLRARALSGLGVFKVNNTHENKSLKDLYSHSCLLGSIQAWLGRKLHFTPVFFYRL
jgi:hypothetical protein